MTRTELATLLASLVTARTITAADAAQVLDAYDRGDLTDADLPAPPPDAHDDDWLAALVLVLLLVNSTGRARLNQARRDLARKRLRGNFDVTMARLAASVTIGALTPVQWQRSVQVALSSYMRQMAVAGAGQLPLAATRAAIEARLAGQWPYLERFAVAVTARDVVGRPLSERFLVARSRMYGAPAWGAFFVAQGEIAAAGWVEQYITRDDPAVCRLCAPRHLQYYLPAQGPMPGECLGTCRCIRVPEFNQEEYFRLTGIGRAA